MTKDKAIRASASLLRNVFNFTDFEGNNNEIKLNAVAATYVAEADGNAEPLINGLEHLIKFCNNLINDMKK